MFVWDNFKESKIKPFIKSISQPIQHEMMKLKKNDK
jgi:hypothetical protein